MSAAPAHKPIVHFVGSIPLPDAETVFRTLAAATGPYLKRLPDAVTIITGRSGRRALISRSNSSPSITGMFMSDRITISCGSVSATSFVECFLTRIGEMQDIGALARLATKLLMEQLGDIGLVIDNQDADAYALFPAA